VKDCLASWLHSADTEAIACTSKVIGGRIYDAINDARNDAWNFILGNSSRRLREMSQVDSRWSNLGENSCDRLPKSCAACRA
jgi:hypothetical protein